MDKMGNEGGFRQTLVKYLLMSLDKTRRGGESKGMSKVHSAIFERKRRAERRGPQPFI